VSYPVSVVRQVAYHALLPFARKGFARLAYASFHGGPRHFLALEDAAERLNKRHGVAAISLFSAAVARLVEGTAIFDGVRDVKGRQVEIDQIRRDHHAGFIETSIALHRWPELVAKGWKDLPPSISDPEGKDAKRNNAFYYGYAAKAGLTERAARAVARVKSIARALAHFRANTYSGYPALASAAEGKALLAHLVEMSAGIVEEFLERGAEMDGHSPLWPAKGFFLSPATNKVADDWLKIYAQ
jgi:creatinine amidohydrolase